MDSNRKIPLIDLSADYLLQRKEILSTIDAVLKKGYVILGEQVSLFEEEFSSLHQAKYGIGVASGTDALILSLKALDIQPGDEVIMPANSYPTAFAVTAVGAVPKLVDITLQDHLIDVSRIEKAITKRTKVILPVHLYGFVVDMDPIVKLAKKYKLAIIEDAAQAHNASYKHHKVGTLGDFGCFSFYPTKNLGTYGDAGLIITNNKRLAQKVKQLRMYGEVKRYKSTMLGMNSRLDEIHAAILRIKLQRLQEITKKRQAVAQLYHKLLSDTSLSLPQLSNHAEHVYHMFVVLTKQRSLLQQFLQIKGITTAIHYPIPIHLVPSFGFLHHKKGDFPAAEYAARKIMTLPCYPTLTHNTVITICKAIKKII